MFGSTMSWPRMPATTVRDNDDEWAQRVNQRTLRIVLRDM